MVSVFASGAPLKYAATEMAAAFRVQRLWPREDGLPESGQPHTVAAKRAQPRASKVSHCSCATCAS